MRDKMPEPISIVAGVTTIVSNVYRISKDVYDLIDAIENAPKHILAVSQDVHGLYGVLGPLQGLLQDLKVQKRPDNVFPIFEGLQQAARPLLLGVSGIADEGLQVHKDDWRYEALEVGGISMAVYREGCQLVSGSLGLI